MQTNADTLDISLHVVKTKHGASKKDNVATASHMMEEVNKQMDQESLKQEYHKKGQVDMEKCVQ